MNAVGEVVSLSAVNSGPSLADIATITRHIAAVRVESSQKKEINNVARHDTGEFDAQTDVRIA